jgi:formylmethanofuran dehydrogenase subunit E
MQDWEYKQWEKRKQIRDKNWKNFNKQSTKRAKSYDDIGKLWKYNKIVNSRIGNPYQVEIGDDKFIRNIRKKKNGHKFDYNKATTEESAKQLKQQYLIEFDRLNNISDRLNFNKRNMDMYKKPMDNRIIHNEHCNHCLGIVRNKPLQRC